MTQHKPLPRARRWHRRAPAVAVCLIAGQLAHAASVKVEIRGVDEELRANVLAYLSFERYRKGGADLNADTVERLHNRVEREVQAALKPFGYYEPQVESTITDLGHNDWRVNIGITPGKPVLIGHVDVRVDGPGETDPFDLTQVLRTQFALDDSQYFSNLEVLPAEPDRTTRIVPVNVHADPSRRHHYSFGPGYATDTGARGTLGFEDRRINQHGHSFSLAVQAAQVTRYSLQSRYNVPFGDPAVEKLTLAGTVEQRQLADVTTHTFSVGPSITEVTGSWQHVWLLTATRTTSDLPAGAEFLPGAHTDRLLVPGIDLASVPKGYLGEALFEHPFFAELRGSHTALGSDSNFIQLHMQVERVFRLGRKWHLLLRDEVGASLVSRFSQLPAVFRFYAGGDNSVRGFGYNDLSPTEALA